MPILAQVGRRHPRVRAMIAALYAVLGLGAVRAAADVDIDLFAAGADTLTLTSPGMANNAMPAWPT